MIKNNDLTKKFRCLNIGCKINSNEDCKAIKILIGTSGTCITQHLNLDKMMEDFYQMSPSINQKDRIKNEKKDKSKNGEIEVSKKGKTNLVARIEKKFSDSKLGKIGIDFRLIAYIICLIILVSWLLIFG